MGTPHVNFMTGITPNATLDGVMPPTLEWSNSVLIEGGVAEGIAALTSKAKSPQQES